MTASPVGPGAGRPDEPPPWRLTDAVTGFLAGIAGSIVAVSAWLAVSGAGEATLGAAMAGLAGLWMATVGFCLWASRARGTGNLVRDFRLRLHGAGDVAIGISAGIGAQVLVFLLYLPLSVFAPEMRERLSEPARRLVEQADGTTLAVLAVMVCVGAPIVEELFFRGLVLPTLTRRFGVGWGVGGSAVAFGVAHFQVLQLPALAAFGVVLALLARAAGRLGPCIVAHTVFNGVTVVGLVASRA